MPHQNLLGQKFNVKQGDLFSTRKILICCFSSMRNNRIAGDSAITLSNSTNFYIIYILCWPLIINFAMCDYRFKHCFSFHLLSARISTSSIQRKITWKLSLTWLQFPPFFFFPHPQKLPRSHLSGFCCWIFPLWLFNFSSTAAVFSFSC